MRRTITGFGQDDVGDWIAELSCRHRQHVHHQPPFWDRPWVLSAEGRAERIGSEIDCPLCDRAELPDGLHVTRTAGPFDAVTLPAGLRRDHVVAAGVWGRLRVLEGAAGFELATEPPLSVRLVAGDAQPIPPTTPHRVVPEDGMLVVVEFLTANG